MWFDQGTVGGGEEDGWHITFQCQTNENIREKHNVPREGGWSSKEAPEEFYKDIQRTPGVEGMDGQRRGEIRTQTQHTFPLYLYYQVGMYFSRVK